MEVCVCTKGGVQGILFGPQLLATQAETDFLYSGESAGSFQASFCNI
jgi:hypothetical protein